MSDLASIFVVVVGRRESELGVARDGSYGASIDAHQPGSRLVTLRLFFVRDDHQLSFYSEEIL